MRDKKAKDAKKKDSTDYIDRASGKTGSAGDMTGLIPAAPDEGHQIDACNALYSHDTEARKKGRKETF